jgi:hypothetical protein
MIIRLKFASLIPFNTVRIFLHNPKGTCLVSSGAQNITPENIKENVYVSFWHIDDKALKEFFGGKVTIDALRTYPGVRDVKILDFEKDLTSEAIHYTITRDELDELLAPFV